MTKFMLVSLGLMLTFFSFESKPATASTRPLDPALEVEKNLVIVAARRSPDESLQPLQFSDDDAIAYLGLLGRGMTRKLLFAEVDEETGRLWPELSRRFQNPSRDAVLDGVLALSEQMEASDKKQEVFLIMLGHGGADSVGNGYMVLADGVLEHEDLVQILSLFGTSRVHLIVDACQAYDFVRPRGHWVPDTIDLDVKSELADAVKSEGLGKRFRNTGFILSSASGVNSMEFSLYRGGVFSYLLRSAMYGGADLNGDGCVTYLEVSAFMAASVAGVEGPRDYLNHFIQAPGGLDENVLWCNDRKEVAVIEIDTPGHVWFFDRRAFRMADVSVAGDSVLSLELPLDRGPYRAFNDKGEIVLPLVEEGPVRLSEGKPRPAEVAMKSAVSDVLKQGLFRVPFGQGFLQGFMAGGRGAQDVVLVERPEPMVLSMGYFASSVPFGLSGLSHGVQAAVGFGLNRFVTLGIQGAFQTSHHDLEDRSILLQTWNLAVLGRLTSPKPLWFGWLRPFVEFSAGHLWVILDDDQAVTKGDALSFRSSLQGGVEMMLPWGGLSLNLLGGGVMSLVTLDGEEDLFWDVTGGLFLGWRL